MTGDILQAFTPAWLRRHTEGDEACTLTDVTSAYTILSLQGPKSREVLVGMTGEDLSTAALPFRAAGCWTSAPSRCGLSG